MPAHVVTPAASIARAFASASDAASAKATRRAFTPSARSRAALRGRAPSTFRLSGTPAPRVVGRVVVASAAAATPSAGEDADNTAGGVPSWHPDVLDPDQIDGDVPTPGFATIASALEDVAAGKFVVVLDDEDRENEGDLIGAADAMTAESIAFMIKHTSGLLCVAVDDETADRLNLPLMVTSKENEDAMKTAFTVSCDLAASTTGISAGERAATIAKLGDAKAHKDEFVRPGHVFPLRYREGGVLKRTGHTEAAYDLAKLSGRGAAGVLCEITNDDAEGTMARLPQLREFSKKHDLKMILISDLVRYRRKREVLVRRTASARVPTEHGAFTAVSYKSETDGIEHVAFVYGNLDDEGKENGGSLADGDNVLVRVHSECLTGDIFGSSRCDCGNQLDMAMQRVASEGKGVIVYLRGQEGRGIGLGHKLRAYNLQDEGRDTVQANEDLGLPVDSREYGVGAAILRDLGVKTIRLMTNNPAKYHGLKGFGLTIVGRSPLFAPITLENKRYIETKRAKMGHMFGDESGAFEEAVEAAEEVNVEVA
jgi:3,4-dihydroxy 2-butanone 4-phosphate synthase/GTP cyclohydrolase II